MSQSTTCPECDADLVIEAGTINGEIITCDACDIDLEVMKLEPITLEIAPEEEEDWGE
ncbi:MAG: lysine biosynthesis protein LysW [Candidatus Marinimicrobia bacterium]|nr:lysine biosynthesis protein LysW [Candidatus Neomarinimicrobiota bacterium]